MTAIAPALPRKKLPIGIQTFREIREEGYYYVDKTPLALRLIEEGKYYFLSRPRRFGKSLLIDTLAELFAGHRALFQGLHAENHWDWSKAYPVIRLSFGGGVLRSGQALQQSIHQQLVRAETAAGMTAQFPDARSRFASLIEHLHRQSGQRVVVLVDEYDKPILDNLTAPDMARDLRDGLRDLYSVIKDEDAHIRFAMLTGVSKFSKVSLFSGLNNLRDITVSPGFSAICGYTDADVDTVFAPELPGLDREDIRRWYNGYNWTGESVYNPHLLLLHLSNPTHCASWFENGTPSFLIAQLRQRAHWTPPLGQNEIPTGDWMDEGIDALPLEALLFETGYLTIDTQTPAHHANRYRLRYANENTRSSLVGYFLNRLLPNTGDFYRTSLNVVTPLETGRPEALQEPIERVFAELCAQWCRSKPLEQLDGYWSSLFHAMFANLGFDCEVEDTTNKGRIDMAVLFNGQVFLFEFKVVELAPEGRALQQLIDKGYADKYRARGEPIHLVGVEFSKDQRSVVGFAAETLSIK